MMEARRHLAVVSGYQGLIVAIRARKVEMGISDTELEAIADLTRGHVSKLLAPGGKKTLGPLSMGRLLRALGLELIVAENVDQTAKVRELYERRDEKQVRKRVVLGIASIAEMPWLFDREKASKSRLNQIAMQSEKKRRSIARKAIRTRWRRVREEQRRCRVLLDAPGEGGAQRR